MPIGENRADNQERWKIWYILIGHVEDVKEEDFFHHARERFWAGNGYMKLIKGRDDPTRINVQGWRHWKNLLEKIGFNGVEIKGSLIHGFPPTTTLRGEV